MNNKTIFMTFMAFIISGLLLSAGFIPQQYKHPQEVYRVYLAGKSIGLINEKAELDNYINERQTEIKEKYEVENVYAPTNLDVLKERTYAEKISTVEEIYNILEEESYFSLEGYKIIIDAHKELYADYATDKEEQIFYVLDDQMFFDSVNVFVKSFLSDKDLAEYENQVEKDISSGGSNIKEIYTDPLEFRVIKEKIPVEKKIYTEEEELTRYLLFGEEYNEDTYIIEAGETIEEVAFKNKMSINELLVLNEEINSAKDLLFPGQEVKVGILNPQFQVKTVSEVVEQEEVKFKTTVKYDPNKLIGYSVVEQAGKNGINKLTKTVEVANGEIVTFEITKQETIVEAVEEIIVRGGSYGGPIGDVGLWAWPSEHYSITSSFGYRWGNLHAAIDIGGRKGSKIFAANSGTVTVSKFHPKNGNYIVIDHNNGYVSEYAHLSGLAVKPGDIVQRGQTIGYMGNTGYVVAGTGGDGTHLHFGIFRNNTKKDNALNPLGFYRWESQY